jgi:hypothetical protein
MAAPWPQGRSTGSVRGGAGNGLGSHQECGRPDGVVTLNMRRFWANLDGSARSGITFDRGRVIRRRSDGLGSPARGTAHEPTFR